jgi:NADPH:quinone reductase-like Zn-dependent oxidoreductase
MGLEIAGMIVKIAEGAKEKSNWRIGDKVCALLGGGGYAEYANVKYDMLMPVPFGWRKYASPQTRYETRLLYGALRV